MKNDTAAISKAISSASLSLLILSSAHIHASTAINPAANNDEQIIAENTPPQFKQPSIVRVTEGGALRLQLQASDSERDAIIFSLIEGPNNLSVSSNGLLQWSPGFSDAGTHSVHIKVSDGKKSSSDKLTIVVENANRVPIITSDPLRKIAEAHTYTYAVAAKDADDTLLTYTLGRSPAGMEIDGQLISWTPSYADAGKHHFTVVVTDGEASSEQKVQLTVINSNRAPTWDTSFLGNAKEGQPLKTPLKSSDADNDVLSFSVVKGPKQLVIDSNNQLNWTPSYDDEGEYTIEISTSDGEASISKSFIINVANTNRAPTWPKQQLPEASESIKYNSALKASDADGDAITFTLKQGPQGLTVSPAGIIEWQPNYSSAGIQQLQVIASDGQGSTPLSLTLKTKNTNRKPEFIAQPPLIAAENKNYQYDVPVVDPDGDKIIKRLLTSPEGMKLDNNKLFWKPGFEQAGRHQVTLEISDHGLTNQQSFTLQVSNTNRKPSFLPIKSGALSVAESQDFSLPIQAQDDDGDLLSFKISSAPSGMVLRDKTLAWKPSYIQAGIHKIKISVSDSKVATFLNFNVTVSNTNRPPIIISKAPTSSAEGEPYEYEIKVSDPDVTDDKASLEKVSYKLLLGPEGMVLENNRLSWLPGFERSGRHQVHLQASDGKLNVSQKYEIDVADTNRAPDFVSSPNTSALENTHYEYIIETKDDDGNELTLTLDEGPAGLALNGNVLSWTPSFTDANEYVVTVKADDGSLQTAQSYRLKVKNNNRPPKFISNPDAIAYENVTFNYHIKASDADNEKLELALLKGPEGMRLSGDGTLIWLPHFAQDGSHIVKLSVTDGKDSSFQDFVLEVENTNRPPQIEKIPDQHVLTGGKFRYQLKTKDIDGGALTYRLVHSPKTMEINKKGKLSWKPNLKDKGMHTIIVSVSDGDLKLRRHFDIKVE